MPRILVIDDDSQVLKMLQEMLANYDVIAADGGRKGLEILRREAVDVVIVDMLMPDIDGLETIRTIRKDGPGTPIIALSGGGAFGRFDLLEAAKQAGAEESLQKPVDWEELTTVIARVVGGNGLSA